MTREISAVETLVALLRDFVIAPLTGLAIFFALALMLARRGLKESANSADPRERLLDRRMTLLLAAFTSVVVARFLLFSG